VTAKLDKAQGRFSETTIDDEIVVMRLDNGEFFSLTGTARSIWLLLDGVRDQAGLLAALSVEYDCEPESLSSDVDVFLQELEVAGLLARQ
jgi:hypothetical protein